MKFDFMIPFNLVNGYSLFGSSTRDSFCSFSVLPDLVEGVDPALWCLSLRAKSSVEPMQYIVEKIQIKKGPAMLRGPVESRKAAGRTDDLPVPKNYGTGREAK